MCWRDDIVELRHCPICGQRYYGDLGHRGCPGFRKTAATSEPRRTTPPEGCGLSNEDLECLGCGQKLGCIKPGHCYAVDGQAAFKK